MQSKGMGHVWATEDVWFAKIKMPLRYCTEMHYNFAILICEYQV